jgi:hypothetical protein
MNCKEVGETLSDYVDGTLRGEALREVEAHLSSCARCLADSKEMSKTIEAVGALPEVDVPPGFSERVMSRVREEAGRRPLWERFFLPIRIKLPLHATALLVVVGLAVYLYEANLPVQREIARSVPSESIPPAREELMKEKKDILPEPASPPLEQFGGEAPGRRDESTSGKAVGGLRSLPDNVRERLEEKKATPQGIGQAAAGAEEYEVVLTPAEPLEGTEALARKIDDLVKKVGGVYLNPEESSKEIASDLLLKPQTIRLNIPADRYGQFRKELSSLGKLAPETKFLSTDALRPSSKSSSFLTIKLIILLPEKSKKAEKTDQPIISISPEPGRK